jgi:cobalt-zinc-cadmium efflux system outer membrane protein
MKRTTLLSLIGLMAGCATYRADEGWPEPRPLGREYGAYRPPEPMEEIPSAHRPPLPEEGEVSISLGDATALAFLRNPQLAAFSWGVRAAGARRLQAGLLPNPTLNAEVEEFSGDRSGFRDAETTVSISQLVVLGGKRARRVQLAELERDLAGWDYESSRLDVLTDVVRAFAAVLGAQRTAELTAETVRIAERVAAAAATRVEAGAAPPVEETRAGVALSLAQIELRRARADLAVARRRLAATWGASEASFSRAEGELDAVVTLPDLQYLEERLDQNPELARRALDVHRRRAALDVEKAEGIPDVTLEAGYRRLEGDNADTFVAGVSVPMPFFNRNQGGILEAQFRLARAESENEAAQARVHSELADAYLALQTAMETVRAFRDAVLPGVERAFEVIREGYEQGTFEQLDLLEAQRALAAERIQYVEALVSLCHARADVERLIGESLLAVNKRTQEDREDRR